MIKLESKKIAHTIVLYNNDKEVLDHIKALSNQTYSNNIIVLITINKMNLIDRNEFERSVSKINIDAYVFNPNTNLGYLNGCLYGYEKLKEQLINVEYVTISNTDIDFSSTDFYENLVLSNYDENCWCIAPSIYNSNKKSYDNPEYINRISRRKIEQLITIYSHPKIANIYEIVAHLKGKFFRKKKMQEMNSIYSAKGCFMIIKKDFADILINNKYSMLLYSEESYISELILKFNKKIIYDPSIEVIHYESTVTNKLKKTKKYKYIKESLENILENFYT